MPVIRTTLRPTIRSTTCDTRRADAHPAGSTARWLGTAALAVMLASCAAPQREPAPVPPTPIPTPVPAPAPAPSPYHGDWADWPLTPGDWTYRLSAAGSAALYGVPGRAPVFALRCDRAARTIALAHPGVLEPGRTARMTLRTSAGTSALPVANLGGSPPEVGASVAASDPQLDRMIFSRGRFVVEIDGAPAPLVLPAWPEVARVTEDCRAPG